MLTAVVLWGLAHTIGLFSLSRTRRELPSSDGAIRFIFVVSALNEGSVIGATVRYLLRFAAHAIVVVDDGSTDATADEVRAVGDPSVVLLQRRHPDAAKGKGEALNYAFDWVRRSHLVEGVDRSEVVLCVLDADGRLRPGATAEVTPYFGDPAVGGAQISVRIRNRRDSFWARMQHFEFVAFTALYQRGRERTGCVGLGGNGQFVRLTALESLGSKPWTACLTEDMDLGIRMLLAGWRIRYVPTCWVTQQGIPDLARLVRQRTRWFQGTLQCARHLPRIVRSARLPLITRVDLAGALLTPVAIIMAAPLLVAGWVLIGTSVVSNAGIGAGGWAARAGVMYAMSFLPAVLLAYVYWLDERSTTLPRAIVAGHAFVLYGYLWIVAGWKAVFRSMTRRTEWAKTARLDEEHESAAVAA